MAIINCLSSPRLWAGWMMQNCSKLIQHCCIVKFPPPPPYIVVYIRWALLLLSIKWNIKKYNFLFKTSVQPPSVQLGQSYEHICKTEKESEMSRRKNELQFIYSINFWAEGKWTHLLSVSLSVNNYSRWHTMKWTSAEKLINSYFYIREDTFVWMPLPLSITLLSL